MILTRNLLNDHHATMGTLESDQGDFGVYTLEPPWRNNEVGKSCIPSGQYEVVWDWYYKGGYTCFGLVDVPGRTEILIHIGNYVKDTEGCILIGLHPSTAVPAVWSSGSALRKLIAYLGGEREEGNPAFTLRIVDEETPQD